MVTRSLKLPDALLLIGTFLILINTIIVASFNSPIIFTSHPIKSVNVLLEPNHKLWTRVSFGFREFVRGPIVMIFIALACINFILAILLYIGRQLPLTLLTMMILSILSILTGGGFFIGTMITIVCGSIVFQRKQTNQGNLMVKILRVLMLDGKVFEDLRKQNDLTQPIYVIILVSLLSSLGTTFYAYSVHQIRSSPEMALKVLILGDFVWSNSILWSGFLNIGIAILKWLFLSTMIYLIGVKLVGCQSSFDVVARGVSFAYAPIALQILLPALYFNEPALSFNWPMFVFFATNLWMILALIVATQKSFEISVKRAIGLLLLSGTIYWIAIYKIALSVLKLIEPKFILPGLFFVLEPLEIVASLFSFSIILSLLLGTFFKE